MTSGNIGLLAVSCMRCNERFSSTILLAQHTRFKHPVTELERAEIIALWDNGSNAWQISQEIMRGQGTVKGVILNRVRTKARIDAAFPVDAHTKGISPVKNSEPDTDPLDSISLFKQFVSAFEERVLWFSEIEIERDNTIRERDRTIERQEQVISNLQTQLTTVSTELTSLRHAVHVRSSAVSSSTLLQQKE